MRRFPGGREPSSEHVPGPSQIRDLLYAAIKVLSGDGAKRFSAVFQNDSRNSDSRRKERRIAKHQSLAHPAWCRGRSTHGVRSLSPMKHRMRVSTANLVMASQAALWAVRNREMLRVYHQDFGATAKDPQAGSPQRRLCREWSCEFPEPVLV
jgi:hypothetical protein